MGAKAVKPDPTQIERFKETARALGCDEDEAAFDEKLKVIARQKPKDETRRQDAEPVRGPGRRRPRRA